MSGNGKRFYEIGAKKKILKKVRKTWDLDPASRTKASEVVTPPLRTAGATSLKVLLILSSLVP
jgi:hypothetical protein